MAKTPQFRYSAHYANVLRELNSLYRSGSPSQAVALLLFDADQINIEAGRAWAEQQADSDDEAAQLCSAYPRVGARLLNLRLDPKRRIKWLEAGVASSRRLGDRKTEGRHVGDLASAYAGLGNHRRAAEYHEQSLKIAQDIDDRENEAATLGNLGNDCIELNDVARAIHFLDRSAALYGQLANARGEAEARNSLGVAYRMVEDYTQSAECHRRSIHLCKDIGDQRGEANGHNNIGITYRKQGELSEAAK